jgi:hypothetical protein
MRTVHPLSSWTLIAANLVPLIGVLFFEWNTVMVLALFWIENLIIGMFNMLRMAGASVVHRDASGFFLIAFFLFHYGAFCAAHGKLLMNLLGVPIRPEFDLHSESAGLLNLFTEAGSIVQMIIVDFSPAIWVGLTALLLSKLVSFIENFLLGGEIMRHRPSHFMMRPYAQIVVLHVGLLLGAFVLEKMGSPVWLLAIIVVLKIIADYLQFERRQAAEQSHQIKDI